MKKSIYVVLGTFFLTASAAVMLASCGHGEGDSQGNITTSSIYTQTSSVHSHKASAKWEHDETNHWHKCEGCEEKLNVAAHTFDEGSITTIATKDKDGVKTYTCTVCGYQKTEAVAFVQGKGTLSFNDSYTPGKTYDKTPVTAPVLTDCITNNPTGAFSTAWYQKVDGAYGSTPLTEAPVNAGDYKVVVTIAETDAFTAATAEKEFTIAKKQLTVTGTTVYNKNYTGETRASVKVGTVSGFAPGDEGIKVAGNGKFESALPGTNITVTVTYILFGDGSKNYLAPASETFTADIVDYAKFTVTKAYTVTGRGTAIEGMVDAGVIKVGDTITLSGGSRSISAPVAAIMVDGKTRSDVTHDTSTTATTVALLLRGVSLSDVAVGSIFIKAYDAEA